jgi:GH15 family glucan-1,4-alpha-glucosidase
LDRKEEERYSPIEHYGMIGNLHTVALVSKRGSIDYFPYSRIDSPTIFASLLDAEKGGSFSIKPEFKEMDYKQLYIPDSAILLTRFLSDEGLAEITDFMPVKHNEDHCVISRTVRTIKGTVKYRMHCRLRPDYGKDSIHIEEGDDGFIIFYNSSDKPYLKLTSNCKLNIEDGAITAEFELQENETTSFVLHSSNEEEDIKKSGSLKEYTDHAYQKTARYWKDWIKTCSYNGRWRSDIFRSAITLKLLSSYDYGSIVAAATFGLPERIGGKRNWDYRYTWIRDAAFSMYSMIQLQFIEEAEKFMGWIIDRSKDKHLQLMYSVDGTSDLHEVTLDHLEGYKNSKPVRIGNGAYNQYQLDIYGELLDTIYLFNKHVKPITRTVWEYVERQVQFVIDHWREPDHGIWEIRSEKKEMLSSRMMCWVALDRAIKIGRKQSFPYPDDHWVEVRNEIYNDIFDNFWNEELQSFVQFKGSKILDASTLLMPLVMLISPDEPKWRSTFKAIEQHLVTDMLVYRYNTEHNIDGFGTEEGTFTMCSFWYIENLAKIGRVEEARLQFEKMIGYANHLGLFSEQLGIRGNHLGNYPQAFTHLGLISAAFTLDYEIDLKGKRYTTQL